MTENKRFIIDVEETTQENALFENGKFVCFEDDTDEYLKKINEMSDENEQLKQTIETQNFNYDNAKSIIHDSENQIRKLKKENEQLKEEIKDLNDVLARYEEKELQE